MAPPTINVLLTSFPGLGLPSTLSLPLPSSTSVAELQERLSERIPANHRYILTTISNKQLSNSDTTPLGDLLNTPSDGFLSLRLSLPLCGGKGGFGSQLRAAGGRMASKKKRNGVEQNSESRNLDGRRLKTVAEAKALAEYLSIKPDMDKKEREERRRRWEAVVEMAEKKTEEIRGGKGARVDGRWVEDKEEAGERTREAVLAAMRRGDYKDNLRGSLLGRSESSDGSEEDMARDASSTVTTPPSDAGPSKPSTQKFFGFDEDDEFMSDDDDIVPRAEKAADVEQEDATDEPATKQVLPEPIPERAATRAKGKGKAKAAPVAKAVVKKRATRSTKA